jgi:transposase-like protein
MLAAGLPARPPHCPNPACDFHACSQGWRFRRKGYFHRQRRPRRVQRYLCQHCGRTFSSQTFSTTYWLKRPGFLRALFFRTVACSANRQIARELGVSHSTVQRQIERLGRHCLLIHEHLRPRGVPREPLVLDGFRSLESGHYWPFDLNHLVGASHFVYAFNEAELRRSGTMRPGQRRHRARLETRHGRPDGRATRRAVEELVGRVVPRGGEVVIRSDEHRAYAQAFGRLRARGRRIRHETTSSRAARTTRNPLFPANLADLLLRHSGSNHKRETIAFSKRRQGAMYRMAIFVVWRNYVKSRSERRRDAPPGVGLGVIERALRTEEVLGRRLFPSRVRLRGWAARCYAGQIATRCLPGGGTSHRLQYAA